MTINTTQTRIDYAGNGVTTAFAVPFNFFGQDELDVILRTNATGAETAWVRGVNYTVTGGDGTTGTVTATVAPATGFTLFIIRNTDRLQQIDLQSNGPFPADTVERMADRPIAILQEIDGRFDRVLRVADTDAPISPLPNSTVRADTVLTFDSSGNIQLLDLDGLGGVVGPAGPAGPAGASVPEGTIAWFAGSTLPAGWLWCNGATVSRTAYAALFTAISTTYGTGDGSTTFGLPNIKGRTIAGKGDMGGTAAANLITSAVSGIDGNVLGATGGDERLHQHNHPVSDPGHAHSATVSAHQHTYVRKGAHNGVNNDYAAGTAGSDITDNTGGTTPTSTVASNTTGLTVGNSGGGASQNMQPTIILNAIIYAGGVVPPAASYNGTVLFPWGGTVTTGLAEIGRAVASFDFTLTAGTSVFVAASGTAPSSSTTYTLFRDDGATSTSVGTAVFSNGSTRTVTVTITSTTTFTALTHALRATAPASPDTAHADFVIPVPYTRA